MRKFVFAVSVLALVVLGAWPVGPANASTTPTTDPPPMALPADPWFGAATFQSIASVAGAVMLVGSSTPHGGSETANVGLWVRGLGSGTADPAFGTNGTVLWPPDGSLSGLYLEPSGVAHALFTPDGADRPRAIASLEADGTPRSLVELALLDPAAEAPLAQPLISASGVVLIHRKGASAVTVERYLLDGLPDTSFGSTASVTVPTPATAIHEIHASLTGDGGLLVVAAGLQGADHTMFRLDASGTVIMDPTVITMAGAGPAVHAVAAIGERTLVTSWTSVVAFLPNGVRDPTYGVNGMAALAWGAGFWFAPDGSAVAIETWLPSESLLVRLARLATNGEVLSVQELPHPFQVALAARTDDGSYWIAPLTAYRSSNVEVPELRPVSLLAPDGRVNVGFPPRHDLPSVGADLHPISGPLAIWAASLIMLGAALVAFASVGHHRRRSRVPAPWRSIARGTTSSRLP